MLSTSRITNFGFVFKHIKIYLLALAMIFLTTAGTFAQAPNWEWAKSAGVSQNDDGNSIFTDAAGNIYATGSFDGGSITFGTTTLTSAGDYDIYIVKYSADGNVLWAKSAGGSGLDDSYGICTDDNGNIFITGFFSSENINFGSTTLFNPNSDFGYDSFFIAKYDSNGNPLWAKTADGLGNIDGNSIALDNNGNIVITGFFDSNDATFEPITLINTKALFSDIFIVKYNTDGNVVWAKSAGSNYYDNSSGISIDNNGDIFVTGYFSGTVINFDSVALTNSGGEDVFVAKFDADGNIIWANSAIGTDDDNGIGISSDNDGNVFLTGFFASETISFGAITLTGNGYDNIFVVKYDAAGSVEWAKSEGGDDNDEGMNISVDNSGNVFVVGEFESNTITFGSTTLTNSIVDYSDIFITKYDNTGNIQWATSVGHNDDDEIESVATDSFGKVYVTGSFYSKTINFGTTTLVNANNTGNSTDLFIAKLNNVNSIDEQSLHNSYIVYPNPFTNSIEIKNANNSVAEIMNVWGQQIKRIRIENSETPIDVSDLLPGIYFLRLTGKTGISVKKIIKE